MTRLREILTTLSELGDEPWKTPGHPMNVWVPKSSVQSMAREALTLLEEKEQTGLGTSPSPEY